MNKKILGSVMLFSFCFLGFANASNENWCYDFKNDIEFGDKGSDVEALKVLLASEGFYKQGWVSDSFDVYMAAAVMGFQDKYKSEILKPIGLTNPTGTVSTMTLKKLNSLSSCEQGKVRDVSVVTIDNQSVSIEKVNTEKRDNVIKIALDYIKKYLVSGMDVVIDKTEDVIRPFYRFEAKTTNNVVVPTYVSTDGKVMTFQETDLTKQPETPVQETVATEIKKTDKPQVELFVMSHCPYGAQIEKGIIPAIEALGSNVDFQLKFCNYSMHGEAELKEQLNQYCIQKEQKDKLLSYLKCFLKDGNSDQCIISTSIDKVKLSACISSADKEFKVLDNFKNNVGYVSEFPGFDVFKEDNLKYGVQGSPTLVINGVQSSSGRDSNSLLKTICSGFNNSPEVCTSTLSTDNPVPGFGDGTSGQGTAGGCGK
ncbi:MAG: peptidoglycan-binding domain-containing protein [Candidatus Pacebacteria bacterium]|nr:peptidoglycan-binding domain-containing protein [Candidatus Paceibacterota bacterium]